MKDGFLAQWLALPPRENHQVQEKIRLLLENPLPDAKTKKQLKHIDPRLHRIRSGDYRIFYTFAKPYISLLEVSKRDEDTYQHAPAADSFGGLALDVPTELAPSNRPEPKTQSRRGRSTRALPVEFDSDLLTRLRVPSELHPVLLPVHSEEELLSCPGVPDDVLLRIHQALFEQPFEDLFEQREHVAQDIDDLLRYKEGELLGFLLRLTPEQQKFVEWATEAAGPTLVKGGPGTGKSTVALYRVRAMLHALKKTGVTSPRILFTTYTNALVAFSRQLLENLLGVDADCVDIRTADSLARDVVNAAGCLLPFVSLPDLKGHLAEAIASARFGGSSLEQRSQAQLLQRIGMDYLVDEICTVIDARGLVDLDAYLAAPRPGRKLPLNGNQRRAVWIVREALHERLAKQGVMTWQQLRSKAVELVKAGSGPAGFDAVVVDEVQDLDATIVDMLARLTKSPGRLFLTADANQSIFGSGFRWQDVHESLRFRGRTGILRTNHRSTQEVGEATGSYLAQGALERDAQPTTYTHHGPMPAVRGVTNVADELKLIVKFFHIACRDLHLGPGAGAVFVPTERSGKRISAALSESGYPARFMTGRELDLRAPCVKVMTLKSAKGLEFPIVTLAGFGDAPYPFFPSALTPEEKEERLAQERRTLYVAMTRAMRVLLVIRPTENEESPLSGFMPELWNATRGNAGA